MPLYFSAVTLHAQRSRGGDFYCHISPHSEGSCVARLRSVATPCQGNSDPESLTVYTTVNSDSVGNNNSNFPRDAAETSTAAMLKTDERRRADEIPADVAKAINVAVMNPPTIADSLSASAAVCWLKMFRLNFTSIVATPPSHGFLLLFDLLI